MKYGNKVYYRHQYKLRRRILCSVKYMTNWETIAQTRFLISFSFEIKKCTSAISVLLMSVLEPMPLVQIIIETWGMAT